MSSIVNPNYSILRVLVLCGLILSGSGCDNQAAQEDFIDEASALPEGITKILDADFVNADDGICSEDPDDWRVSPVYAGVVFVDRPAFPNPATGASQGTIVIRVLQPNRVQGGFILTAFGNGSVPIELARIPDASLDNFYDIRFSPSLLSINGLHRLFLFDSLGELITYGDLELTSALPTSC
ncbi:MAG: hypothetical protein KTR29_16565 [Rhodothermaceae bacterium]|nr:hypothetical protein [Rhodothermaceae bacterium]